MPDEASVAALWVDVTIDEWWTASIAITPSEQGAMVREMHLRGRADGEPMLSSRLLRRLGMTEIREQLDADLRTMAVGLPTGAALRLSPPRPGKRARPDSWYAQRVREYERALVAAPDRPVRWLVEQHPETSRSKWYGWFKIAEERGLMEGRPGPRTGEAGGRLTPKGRAALESRGRR